MILLPVIIDYYTAEKNGDIVAKKLAFVYAHGGPVFQTGTHDGLNERGRNLVVSIRSAAESGADKIFISESICQGNPSQVELLIKSGKFYGLENIIDFVACHVGKEVRFPKNYLFNRGAQRAKGFFALVFPDSDVLFPAGFPQRSINILRKCDFAQPEYIMYQDPKGNDQSYLETTMKRAVVAHEAYSTNLSYLEGMPGMVNIVNRDRLLEIGGFSQAISGVNFEDIEYQIRLKILGMKMDFIHDEWCRHLHHSRSSITRQAENLSNMFFENANFMNWWVDYYIQIRGNDYNTGNFQIYMQRIKESLNSNKNNNDIYSNKTGSITHDFNPETRYRGFVFGAAEPYVESGTKEEKIAAVINAANFWHLSYEEIIRINPGKFHDISPEDVKRAEGGKPHTVLKPTHEGNEDELDSVFDNILNEDEDTDEAFNDALASGEDDLDSEFERILNEA